MSKSDDLISRRAAIDKVEEWIETYNSGRGGKRERDAIKRVISRIKKLPSAEPEIIRCKDCKYASPNGKYGCKAYHFKLYETHEMNADDYCSRAERRTDDER